MLGQEQDNGRPSAAGGGGGANRKSYLRSVSWTDRSPRTPSPRPKPNNKSRLCLPPLQPLWISQKNLEDWPKAGSDDLGIWPQAPTPGAKGSIKQTLNLDSEQPEREFECKKDKLAFFDKECSRITDHIYLGSDAVAKNREVLRDNGITHVLNCVGFVCPEYFKNELVYKTLWLHDSPSEDITSILYDVFDYFEDVREQSGRVLVHCCQGVSRSTSLVIAYLMWWKKQTFEDAFQYVKAARGVTNPNMGFACQLLLCQNRTLDFLASPNSVLRMYHMAPHSPYDPLHLVPKMLSQTGAEGLDSRGAFIIHVPSAVYVWIGKYCVSVMSDIAREAAFQVIRYEMAQGPVVTIEEGKEPSEFWESIVNKELLADGSGENGSAFDGERKVDLYDKDFEMFHKALSGGIVPPFPLSGARSETCLPARENGWGILRKKFARGNLKELIRSSKLSIEATTSSHGSDYPDSPLPSSCKSGSPDLFFCSPTGSLSDPLTDPLSSPTPSCSYSFSSFLESSPKFGSKSPSLSPSTSDFSSSFTFSPSSSNWSDLSYLSSQSSPSGLESPNPYRKNDTSLGENVCYLCKRTSHSWEKAFSGNHVLTESNACFPCKGTTLSIAERRGSNPPPRMRLPSVDETSQVPQRLTRSYSFSLPDSEDSVMRDVECNQSEQEGFLDAEMVDVPPNELQCDIERREYDAFDLPSSDARSSVTEAEVTNLVLYKWPTLDKVDMHPFNNLDSTSVYLTYDSVGSSGTNNANVLYIWLGRQFSCGDGKHQLISSDEGSENSHIQWDTVGCNFLKQMGLPLNSSVQIVREGEEPEQLLNHLNWFSFHKAET
ncbi:protein-tyrosine-phosphatase MKP1-like [Rhododendron vialii]|uniref:protein-tyrosine-phosphatase MKP1-like n=1 Tax=Rhododendron vialii TaxID=182163 RepID=UPI00265DD848|nr:protein-tyrosine-phosphatase MKP1-like [Rhododendron vialii]XP_058193805.1 protein-tyrosine-phosphatase MKP1-like [Rhododendron vialii]